MRPHVMREGIARLMFGAAAAISIAAVMLICVFLLANGVPAMAEIGLPDFLFGTTWRPANDLYGIAPMIVGSIYVTAGALIVGVPSGIMASIVLGLGRALGETMAVVMVAGNMPVFPDSLLSGVRTLTANIVLEMGYAADLHRGALIATGVVLLVFILLITLALNEIRKRGEAK